MRRRVTALLVAFAALMTGVAAADIRPGAYDIAEANGPRRCRIMLGAGERGAPAGPARIPATCRLAFTFLRPVQSWRPTAGGGVALTEPGGRIVLELAAAAPEEWRGEAAGAPIAIRRVGDDPRAARELPRLYARPAPPPLPDSARLADTEVPGRYTTARARGLEACALVLTERPTAGNARVADLAGACADRGLQTFAPVAWRIEGGRLVLIARRGHDIRFAWDAAAKRWRKDPPSGAELFLAR